VYRIGKLIYAETTDDIWAALAREKQIKGWTREKKLALVRERNPASVFEVPVDVGGQGLV
jgi:putative endonuclease